MLVKVSVRGGFSVDKYDRIRLRSGAVYLKITDKNREKRRCNRFKVALKSSGAGCAGYFA